MYKKVLLACAVAAGLAHGETVEMKWDSGTFGYRVYHDKGLGTWYANDFDASDYD
jgi:hypothetical protein